MDTIIVKLKDVQPNPYREIGKYKLQKARVSALVDSINSTGFWSNVVGRMNGKKFEIAYGHHRLEAAKQALGPNHKQMFVVADLSDYQMLQMMSAENSEDWGNTTEHDNLTVEAARDMLDEWFDEVKVLDDDGKLDWNAFMGVLAKLPEPPHGITLDKAIEWFGNGSKDGAKAQLQKMVKHSAGRGVIAKFMGMKDSSVRMALSNIPVSSKEAAELERKAEAAREAERKAQDKLKAERAAAKKATTEREKAERAAAEKRVQDELDAANEARELAESAIVDTYDPKSGEVFDKPIHGAAFRELVTSGYFETHLPVENQERFAKELKKRVGEKKMSAHQIKVTGRDMLREQVGQLEDSKTSDVLLKYRDLIDNVVRGSASMRTALQQLSKEMSADGVKFSGDRAESLNGDIVKTMAAIGNFYGGQGRFAPAMSYHMEGTKIQYMVFDTNREPMYTVGDVFDKWGIDLDEYEEVG